MNGETNYPLGFKLAPWIIVIISCVILSLVIIKRNKSIVKAYKLQRRFNLVLVNVFMGFSFGRLFFLFSDMERVLNGRTTLHFMLVYASYLITYSMFFVLVYYFDVFIVKSRYYILTKVSFFMILFCIALFFLSFFVEAIFENFKMFLLPGLYATVIASVLVILRMLWKINFTVSKPALYFGIGMFTAALGSLTDSEVLYELIYLDYPELVIIPPIITLLGVVTMVSYSDGAFKLLLEYYTSKKICLVHRGETKEKMYYCPQCLVKYCKKCFNSVIVLENKCWACNHKFTEGETPQQDIELGKVEMSYRKKIED